MKRIFLLMICYAAACSGLHAQDMAPQAPRQDSVLLKFVRGIDGVIRERAKLTGSTKFAGSNGVIIGREYVPVDSLYKYSINDFKEVTISFDSSLPVYGSAAQFGIIILHKKNNSFKKRKKHRND